MTDRRKTTKKNIIFLGQKKLGLDCLKCIYKMQDINIKGVWTWPENTVVWWKKLYLREFIKKEKIRSINIEDILKMDDIDFIISVLYPYILSKEIINKARIAAINVHQAPLPEYRGCNSGSHAIMNGERYFGVTLHLINEKIDEGDIIDKIVFNINDNITAKELYDKTNYYCLKIFRKNIRNILNNEFNCYPQDKNIKSLYYERDSLKEKKVDLNWSFRTIWDFVRGNEFPPFEPAYIGDEGKKIYLKIR